MNLAQFSMEAMTLAGSLESKVDANVAAGFTQVALCAKDLVGHPDGYEAALGEVRLSGVRVNAIQVMPRCRSRLRVSGAVCLARISGWQRSESGFQPIQLFVEMTNALALNEKLAIYRLLTKTS